MVKLRIGLALILVLVAVPSVPANAQPLDPPVPSPAPPPPAPLPPPTTIPLPPTGEPFVLDYPAPRPGSADLRGIVLDQATGKPIAGAAVSLLPDGTATISDAHGEFAFTSIETDGVFELVTIVVTAPGYGIWKRIDDRLYTDHWAFWDVLLGPTDVISTAIPPLTESGQEAPRASSDRFGFSRPLPAYGVPVYSDEWLTPPNIRVERLQKGQFCAPTYPLTVISREQYPLEYYINKVLPMEIAPTWPTEAIKANSMLIKNYAWYWINRGGKNYTGADVDDTTQYQCFDSNAPVYDTFVSATAATRGLGIHVQNNTVIYQSQYLGYVAGDSRTWEQCGNSDGQMFYQLGSKAWASPGCGSRDFLWMLNHYYNAAGITVFNVAAPAAAAITWKRTNESPISIHFETKGAWEYVVYKWTPPTWTQQTWLRLDTYGNLQNWWSDYGVSQGVGETYGVYARGSGDWSPLAYIGTENGWTTDLWNPGFENALNGVQSWFWSSFNGPATGIVPGWGSDSALRFTSPTGTWSSIYQDVPFQTTVCPNLVARQPVGSGQAIRLTLFVFALPSAVYYGQTWSIPADGVWYRIPLNPDGCRTFAAGDSTLRFQVHLDDGGTIDIDRTRLVFDPTTYWSY